MFLEKEMDMEPCLAIDFLSNSLLANYTDLFFNLVSIVMTLTVFYVIVAF